MKETNTEKKPITYSTNSTKRTNNLWRRFLNSKRLKLSITQRLKNAPYWRKK